VKTVLCILCLIWCAETKAQSIPAIYLAEQQEKGFLNSKSQYLRLQSLLNEYKLSTGKDLQKSPTVYFLEEFAVVAYSTVIIWTKTDTIFNQLDVISRFSDKNYAQAKPHNFQHIQNPNKKHFLSLMDFVSKTSVANLTEEIKKKEIPPGKLLDGSVYSLYIFNKKGRNYRANIYFFSDLAL
jgi:hypothetical protein